MKLGSKSEVLKYLHWYMDLIGVHITLFGQNSSNYFILVNKVILLCYYNNISLSEIKNVYNQSNLSYFGIGYNKFNGLDKLQVENLN